MLLINLEMINYKKHPLQETRQDNFITVFAHNTVDRPGTAGSKS